jgi:hypothetical protein
MSDAISIMSTESFFNTTEPDINDNTCAWWVVHGAKPVADSDVSGIGAVVAFILSAYITIALAIAAYLLGAIDTKLLGPVDLVVHRIPSQPRISASWQKALDACVLLFSDQQIMTGLAILIAGFVGLNDRLDVYHFQVVIMLAWMSSSVNLTALTVLGQYFEEHKAVLHWRLAGMLTVLILLFVALIPTTSNHWALLATEKGDGITMTGWAVPARCYYIHQMGGGVNADAPLSFILLIISYMWKLGSLSHKTRSVFNQWIRGPPERFLERMIRKENETGSSRNSTRRSVRYYVCMVFYIDFLVAFEFAASFAASLWISVIGLAYGTIQTIIPRRQNAIYFGAEDEWTFGQIVPLILMIQPIGAMLELYRSGESSDTISEPPSVDIRLHSLDAITTPSLGIAPVRETQPGDTSKAALETVVTSLSLESDDLSATVDYKTTIFKSKIFRVLISLTHLNITLFSGLVLAANAQTIGYKATYNYIWFVLAIALYFASLLLTTFAAIPFSGVFRMNLQ